MSKKTTVKDVAREAGVSVATVSYIMNDRKDMKISEATRKKVLQIANLLNYRPNQAAKSLVTGRNSSVGIAYKLYNQSPGRNLEIIEFSTMLIERLYRLKYDVIFLPISDDVDGLQINRNLDAIITIDLTIEQFKILSDNYFVPVINIDMFVEDSLFYQIYSDYPKIIDEAFTIIPDAYIVLDKWANKKYNDFILQNVPKNKILFFDEITPNIQSHISGKKVIVIGSFLALLIQPYLPDNNLIVISSKEKEPLIYNNVKVLHNDISKKANFAINVLLNVLEKKFDLSHDMKI